jgi:hypothetical protein
LATVVSPSCASSTGYSLQNREIMHLSVWAWKGSVECVCGSVWVPEGDNWQRDSPPAAICALESKQGFQTICSHERFWICFKMRLRPDIAVKPRPPPPPSLETSPLAPTVYGTVYYSNLGILRAGTEDSFNIGRARDMDKALDRSTDFTTLPFIYHQGRCNPRDLSITLILSCRTSRRKIWHLLSIKSHSDMWAVVIRKAKRTTKDITRTQIKRYRLEADCRGMMQH